MKATKRKLALLGVAVSMGIAAGLAFGLSQPGPGPASMARTGLLITGLAGFAMIAVGIRRKPPPGRGDGRHR